MPSSDLALSVSGHDVAQSFDHATEKYLLFKQVAIHKSFGNDTQISRTNVMGIGQVGIIPHVIPLKFFFFARKVKCAKPFTEHITESKKLREIFISQVSKVILQSVDMELV